MNPTRSGRRRTIAGAVLVNLFLLLWLLGMTSGLAAGACMNLKRSDLSRLRACSIAILAGTPIRILPEEAAKTSFLFLERGILGAAQDTSDQAKDDMRTAIRNATNGASRLARGQSPHLDRLIHRIGREDPTTSAARLWSEALGEHRATSAPPEAPTRN